MKKWSLVVLFVLFAATSAFAGENGVRPVTATATVDATVATAAPMTLSAALDKVARDYRDMWIPDKQGKMVKRACDFQCTQWCSADRDACRNGGGGSYCDVNWEICMCENSCCWGPYGNQYCP